MARNPRFDVLFEPVRIGPVTAPNRFYQVPHASGMTNSLPQVRAGTIKAYAVTDKIRLPAAPDIPTVDEAGVPGLHIAIWHAFWMPKATPKDIITKLNAAVLETLADAGVRQRLAQLGQEIPDSEQQTPQALFAYQQAEIEKWWPIIKAANIKGE